MSFRLDGFKDLENTFRRIMKSPTPAATTRALRKGAEVIADEARRLVPVSTGNLRDSIIVSERPLGGAFKMDNAVSSGRTNVYVGPRGGGGSPEGFYGHMVEFGTVHMAAQPFMRPAIDNTRGEVERVIARELWSVISDAAKR